MPDIPIAPCAEIPSINFGFKKNCSMKDHNCKGILWGFPARFQATIRNVIRDLWILEKQQNSRIREQGYLSPIHQTAGNGLHVRSYQPGKLLDAITLGGFKIAYGRPGNNEGLQWIAQDFPAVKQYLADAAQWSHSPQIQQSLLQIIQSENATETASGQARD